jgi:hypothetical protein
VADLPVGNEAIRAADLLRPDVAVVDVVPGNVAGLVLARRLGGRDDDLLVVLTSSADRARFAELDGRPFVAKADLCRGELLEAIGDLAGEDRPDRRASRYRDTRSTPTTTQLNPR